MNKLQDILNHLLCKMDCKNHHLHPKKSKLEDESLIKLNCGFLINPTPKTPKKKNPGKGEKTTKLIVKNQ